MNYFKPLNPLKCSPISLVLVTLVSSACVSGHHDAHSGATPTGGQQGGDGTYAGQQTRAIKALSSQEEQDLRLGRGMGLAKAAELNGYPGPMHTHLDQTALLSQAQISKYNTLRGY
jgi:hypothetical protein